MERKNTIIWILIIVLIFISFAYIFKTINIGEGKQNEVLYSIKGRILDKDGTPIKALIFITTIKDIEKSIEPKKVAECNLEGFFKIENLKLGEYVISAEITGKREIASGPISMFIELFRKKVNLNSNLDLETIKVDKEKIITEEISRFYKLN